MTSKDQLKYSYGAFALCVITSTIPQMTIQTFAMIFSIVALIAFYILRSKREKETFEYKETSTLIKNFWIWSAIYVVGMFVAGGLISSFGDMTMMNDWTESVIRGDINPDKESMKQVTEQFMATNFWLVISLTIISVLPAQIYAGLRIKQGLSRLANPPVNEPEAIIG